MKKTLTLIAVLAVGYLLGFLVPSETPESALGQVSFSCWSEIVGEWEALTEPERKAFKYLAASDYFSDQMAGQRNYDGLHLYAVRRGFSLEVPPLADCPSA